MNHDHHHHNQNLPVANPKPRDYLPLASVLAVIIIGTIGLCAGQGFTAMHVLSFSMGLFFLIFGLFKLLDLPNFAMGYREYDLIAKRLPIWGYAYPFIEIALGSAYLTGINMPVLNIITLILSILICIGVGIKLAKRETIMCVCLGNILKVPITYVSLVEYGLMGLMAVAMLFL